jgi:hypothetical protein
LGGAVDVRHCETEQGYKGDDDELGHLCYWDRE